MSVHNIGVTLAMAKGGMFLDEILRITTMTMSSMNVRMNGEK